MALEWAASDDSRVKLIECPSCFADIRGGQAAHLEDCKAFFEAWAP